VFPPKAGKGQRLFRPWRLRVDDVLSHPQQSIQRLTAHRLAGLAPELNILGIPLERITNDTCAEFGR